MEDLEKGMQGEKEKQRLERPRQWAQSARPAQPSMVSDRPARPASSMLSDSPKAKAPPKPVGLEGDLIGGDEEIGGIKEAGIYQGTKYNNLDFDLKRDILKGIIFSEVLSKPKSLRNMKRRG